MASSDPTGNIDLYKSSICRGSSRYHAPRTANGSLLQRSKRRVNSCENQTERLSAQLDRMETKTDRITEMLESLSPRHARKAIDSPTMIHSPGEYAVSPKTPQEITPRYSIARKMTMQKIYPEHGRIIAHNLSRLRPALLRKAKDPDSLRRRFTTSESTTTTTVRDPSGNANRNPTEEPASRASLPILSTFSKGRHTEDSDKKDDAFRQPRPGRGLENKGRNGLWLGNKPNRPRRRLWF